MEKKTFSGISGSTLKIIAILSMLIDHIGAVIFENGLLRSAYVNGNTSLWESLRSIDRVLRMIGRPAFPIFCFLLVEGFIHTKNMKKYALRLFFFALISEIPFNLAIGRTFFAPEYQNVFFTLLIGLIVMIAASHFSKKMWMQVLIFILGMIAGSLLKTDYGYKGVFLIEILYFFRYTRKEQCLAGAAAFCWELTAPLAFFPIFAYNGKRGLVMKYFFYWFYPAHLLLFVVIARYCIQL